jgi:pimeloyl-ACP methyl ester carboxylesterase
MEEFSALLMAYPAKPSNKAGRAVSGGISSLIWTLALLLALSFNSGCITSRSAANQIVEAPNHHDPFGVDRQTKPFWKMLGTNYLLPGTTQPILPLKVPVGPPPAELQMVVMPPQDYHLKITSKIHAAHSGKQSLEFWMLTETNSVSQPASSGQKATIFILHGYMLNKETMIGWAFFLAQSGYRVVLVDIRGHGQSTGDSVSFGKHETEDFRQLLDYLTAHNLCDDNVGVLGYSYGADLALHWAAHDSRVRTVVAIAPFDDPRDAIERFSREMKIHITRGAVEKATVLAAAKMDINWSDWTGEAALRQIHVPVLLIGGGKDTISRPADVAAMQHAAAGEISVIEIPKANHAAIELWFHELSDPVLTWFHQKLSPPTPQTSPDK